MRQPRPFDPGYQAYVPDAVLPRYRHVPGATPHPHRHPAGHSFGADPGAAAKRLQADGWPRNRTYLLAADLYNLAYWWEAHEWWEALWHLEERTAPAGLFLQGLIQIAAGFLKWHQGNARGVALLHGNGRRKLERVLRLTGAGTYMGLDVADFLLRLEGFDQQFPVVCAAAYADPEKAPLIKLQPS